MPKDARITKQQFDAVLFDLDGVLTATANVHAASWKRLFDAYLETVAARGGHKQPPFDIKRDYKHYVDGKPRYDGVQSFLESRELSLPRGTPDSPPDEESICGLGNKKAQMVLDVLETEGVEVYPGAVKLLGFVRRLGLKTAVVSASKNCVAVLQAANLLDQFDARVDGVVAAERGLPGKPDPAPFLAAAEDLGVEPARSVVVEDAISGVQAGRAGGFGLVIGVEHEGDARVLIENGADVVVSDLADVVELSR